jgi:Ser-tRNA(Ala) deacylase AlaX
MEAKPPKGTGRVRLVLIGENGAIDMQPCGGTHVKRSGEIGRVAVTRIETRAGRTGASASRSPEPARELPASSSSRMS